MYVDKALKFKVLETMSTVADNILECITVEIYKERTKTVIIGCIYRSPGSSTEVFKDWMEETFSKINNKTIFICGDLNIERFTQNKDKMTDEFINTKCSLSIYPKMTKPSRITSHCATLIDNIFTRHRKQ